MLIREDFAAGIAKTYQVVGNFFRLKKATGAAGETVDVTFRRGGGTLNVDLTKSDPGDYAFVPEGFDSITVVSTVNQELTMQIARGQVGSNAVLGTVSVIEGGKSRSLAGAAFSASNSSAALAGNYSHVQLWNPAGTGKRLIVTEVLLATAVAGSLSLRRHNVALATLSGAVPMNKRLDAAPVASVAQLRDEQNAAQLGTFAGSVMAAGIASFLWKFSEPYSVEPGFGLQAVGSAVNEIVRANFQWFEETI